MRKMPEMTLFSLLILLLLAVAACGPAPNASTPTPQTLPSVGTSSAYPAPQDGYPAPNQGYPGAEAVPTEPPGRGVEGSGVTFPGQIAFHSLISGSIQIHVMDGSSGVTHQLTTSGGQAYEPGWSPDCSTIVYTQDVGGNLEIYTMSADGSNQRPLLTEARPDTMEYAPAWSPAGDRIAFQTNPEALFNVCIADTTGAIQSCLDRGNFSNAHPSWSPDGNTLLFVSNRTGSYEVYSKDMTSNAEAVQLTDNGGVNFHPRFSPDGQLIVFESQRVGNYDIYVMNRDGSGERQLTNSPEDDTEPSWMGDQIVFTSYRSQDWELYMMPLAGGEATRLTYQPDEDKGPAWCSAQ